MLILFSSSFLQHNHLSDTATGSVVAAVARGTGHVDLFVVRGDGVYTTWWDEKFPGPLIGGWQTWFRIGNPGDAPPAGSVVTAVSRDFDHVDLFVVRADTSGGVSRVYSTRWDASSPGPLNGGWQSWFPIGDAADTVPSGSVVTAVPRNPGHLDIFVVRSDGGLYSTWWDKTHELCNEISPGRSKQGREAVL